MNKEVKITKNIVFKTFSNVVVIVLGMLTSIILTRYFGKESYGFLIMVYAVTGFFFGFSDFGVRWTFNRFLPLFIKSRDYNECNKLVITGFLLQLAGAVFFGAIIYCFSDFISMFMFKEAGLSSFLKIGVFYFIGFSFINTMLQLFQGFQEWLKESLLSIAYPLFLLVLIIFCIVVIKIGDISWVLALNALSAMTVTFAGFVFMPKYISKLGKVNFCDIRQKAKTIGVFGLPMLIAQLNFYIISWFDKILIGRFCPPQDLTLYYIAFLCTSGLMIILKVIETVLLPYVAGISFDSVQDTHRRFGLIFRWFIHISIFLSIFCYFAIYPVIRLFYGPDFGLSVYLFRLSLIAVVLRSFTIVYGIFMINVFNKTKQCALIGLSLTIPNILFNLMLVPSFGAIGAMSAEIASYFVYCMTILLLVRPIRVMIPVRSVKKTIFSLIAVLLLNVFFMFSGFRNLYLAGGMSIILYVTLLKALDEVNSADIGVGKLMFGITRVNIR